MKNRCNNANGDIVHVQWRLKGDTLPCETTLHTGAVVRVTVRGANPAVAQYSLRSASVTVDSVATAPRVPAPSDSSTQSIAAPARPVLLDNNIPQRPAFPIFVSVANKEEPDTMTKRAQNRYHIVEHLDLANRLLEEIASARAAKRPEMDVICDGYAPRMSTLTMQPNDYWAVAENAVFLRRTVRNALKEVLPPVRPTQLRNAQRCIDELTSSPTWGAFMTLGAATAGQAYAESRALLRSYVQRATPLRDTLQSLAISTAGWDPGQQEAITNYRNALLVSLTQLINSAQIAYDNDFTSDGLASVTAGLRDAARWADVIARSDSIAIVQTTVSGGRGRSRNLELDWVPNAGIPNAQSGSEIVLVDRFRGFLLTVTGAAGFAGTQVHDVVTRAAFTPQGVLIADSLDVVENRHLVWRPALSTGLSLNWVARSGFLVGLGTEFAVLSSDAGGATTRIVAPVFHFGRDDLRIFVGNLLGGQDQFSLPPNVDHLRIARTDSIPTDLVVHRRRNWPPDFYIGIVVGSKSLNPTTTQH
ncbi:MAG TPA: hypothetical protein VF092_31830 [Longimicrobium sp.]